MRVQDEQVTFSVFKTMRSPNEVEECAAISMVDSLAVEKLKNNCHEDSLELSILSDADEIANEAIEQIARLDSQVEHEWHFKGVLEKFPQKGEVKESLDDVEVNEPIDLSSSIALLRTPPTDPFWPSSPAPSYYTPFKLEPKMKPFNQAHDFSKPNLVGATYLNCKNHAKLEGIATKNPFVVLYDTYYGRMPLFDECFFKSLT